MEFEPGSSPGLNRFLAAAGQVLEDPSLAEELELKEHVRAVQEFRRALEQTFHRSGRVRTRTQLYRRLEPLIQKEFQNFREAMLKVERFLRKSEPEDLRKGCLRSRAALEALHRYASELQEEERSFQQFSQAPVVQELAAMLEAVEKSQLGVEILQERLTAANTSFKRMDEDLALAGRGKNGPEEMQSLLPRARECVRKLRSVIQEVESACRKGNSYAYAALRAKLVQQGEELVALHRRWMELLAPEIVCPRCQASSPPGSKICQSCQAVLPQLSEAPASTFSLSSESGQGRQRLTYIHQVEAAIESHKAGETSLDELSQTVKWFAGRIRQGRQKLAGIQPPARFESPEAESHARQVRARMESASATLLAGVEALEGYLQGSDPEQLSLALDHLLSGEAQMLEAQQQMSRTAA